MTDLENGNTEATGREASELDVLVMCAYCEYWRREFSVNKRNEILKGFVSGCNYPVNLPDSMPAALKMTAMNWDDGKECGCFKKWDGEVVFAT